MSCFMKTSNVVKYGVWVRIDKENGDLVVFDIMDNRSIIGTLDWNYYTIVLDVPEERTAIKLWSPYSLALVKCGSTALSLRK